LLGAYEKHLSSLRRYVMRLIHVENDVEDVVQEAFMRAYKAEKEGDIRQPKSYLFRVAKHVALNQIRQKTNRPTDFLEDSDPASVLVSDWTLEDEVLAQERLGIHCAAVAALPPRRRKVYLMRKVYGMSHKAIADSLGITVKTVEAHLVKACRQCHTHVKSKTGEVLRFQGKTQGPHNSRKPEVDNG
jgi:RNA polymerase sigma-70 factor (ECF subfamily)